MLLVGSAKRPPLLWTKKEAGLWLAKVLPYFLDFDAAIHTIIDMINVENLIMNFGDIQQRFILFDDPLESERSFVPPPRRSSRPR